MENATQALLIAAAVLIGILILSLGIYLTHILGSNAANIQSKIDSNTIAQFNDKFLKYDGLTDLTMQDIITVKNYALDSNKKYANYNLSRDRAKDNNDYIDVYYNDSRTVAISEAFRALILKDLDEALLEKEMEKINAGKNPNRFTCEVETNTITGRVNKIYFFET